MSRSEFEVLYGGARGGGKTAASIVWAAEWIETGGENVQPAGRRAAAGSGDPVAIHTRSEIDRSCGLGKPWE